MTSPDQVLNDFITAWQAGERPDATAFLRQVPREERAALGERIDAFLDLAPAPPLDEAAAAALLAQPDVAALRELPDVPAEAWPAVLPRLRARVGVTVPELAGRVAAEFGVRGQEARAAELLERLESGRLDPGRVSRRLLGALGSWLGATARDLRDAAAAAVPAPAPAAAPALFRHDGDTGWVESDLQLLHAAAREPAPEALDALDRLFLGGPDA